jgi:hypothetical protein
MNAEANDLAAGAARPARADTPARPRLARGALLVSPNRGRATFGTSIVAKTSLLSTGSRSLK